MLKKKAVTLITEIKSFKKSRRSAKKMLFRQKVKFIMLLSVENKTLGMSLK